MKIRGTWRVKKVLDRLKIKGVILMYHRVANLDFDPWQLNVVPSHFEEHMRVLKKYGRPVQMKELGRTLKGFLFGQRMIVVSFDDGYADNFHNARPVLEKHGIPATFFIVSGAVGSKEEFWWDQLERATLAVNKLPYVFELTIRGTKYHWPINPGTNGKAMGEVPLNGTPLSKTQLHSVLWLILSDLTLGEKKTALQDIARWAGQPLTPRQDYLPMTAEELKILAKSSLFEIGAHTVHHPMLSRLSSDMQKEEIVRSKQDLEKMIGSEITTFSYPHGDHSDVTVQLTKDAGLRCACTVHDAVVTRRDDVYRLPRFKVLDWDGAEFEQHLKTWLRS